MKKVIISGVFFLLTGISLYAQKKQDREAIKKMCGCFEVTFNFAETFNYSKDSLYKPSKNKLASALEYAQLIEDEKGKVSIQHLLQVGDPSNPHVIKHWRQDWLYQNQDFYIFNGDNSWVFKQKDKSKVKKQWTQKVYQVDDSPRYEGSGSWVHVDGKTYWESTTNAPLPRREYTERSDYNITERGNRQEITDFGWIHDQDNKKVIRKAGAKDVVLAEEKGYNVYKRVPDSKCQGAIDWWKKNQSKWQIVRKKWNEVFARNKDLSLQTKVDNKVMFKYLFSEEYSDENSISELIEKFVK